MYCIMKSLVACSGWSGPIASCSDTDPGPRLAALPLPKLCPVGFVFIWAEKEHISTVIKQASHGLTHDGNHSEGCTSVISDIVCI